jgi:hypothetical protein
MAAVRSSKMAVVTYQTMGCHDPEDHMMRFRMKLREE